MKFALVLIGAIAALTYAEAVFFIGTGAAAGATTVSAATAAQGVALAGIGGLVLGAGIIGIAALAAGTRGKRSVQDVVKESAVFSLVSASDTYGCALKLVCLLEAKDDKELTDDDNFILSIFGQHPEAPTIDRMQTARGAYDYAAFMGYKFGVDACDALFHTCDPSYETMIAYVAQLRA